jgi:uncharacterized DUF497 family protein
MINFDQITGFEWDTGNDRKSGLKHAVTNAGAEEVFMNQPLLLYPDLKHSASEPRYMALGSTHEGRRLTIVFTLRKNQSLIRVISARDQHRKERLLYARSR